MKKRFLAIAIAAGLASPLAAHADATVYGKIQLQYGMYSEDADGAGAGEEVDNWQVNSYASRLGFKGEEDLGNGLSATFKLEYEVNPDGDGADDDGIRRRNHYLGLKGGFGEVRVGRHDTPLKMSQGKFDLFNDNQGDIATSIGGNRPTGGDNRFDNVVAYLGKASDIKYAIALIPGEGDGTTNTGDGPADSISAAVIYDAGPIYAALAMDSYDDTTAAGLDEGFEDRTRLTLMYTMGKMRFGLMWEDDGAPAGGNDADMMAVNFKMGMGKNAAKFQYITAEEDNGGELTNMSVGYDIGLSKRTTAYVMYNDQEAEDNAGNTGYEASSIALGMIHKF